MNLLPLQTNLTMKTSPTDHSIRLPLVRHLAVSADLCPSANHIGGHSRVLEKLICMENHRVKPLIEIDPPCHYLLIVRRTTIRPPC